ncbi:MAG TPA: CrcB family protein [Ktedonobacteraceae bacterium]
MNPATLALVGLVGGAGACGALTRYLLTRVIAERSGSSFPWGTLLINVTGAFLIGLFAGLASRHILNVFAQTVLITGFLGGYTTFSTMSWESIQLVRGGNRLLTLLYLGGNMGPGLLAALLGLLMGGWL